MQVLEKATAEVDSLNEESFKDSTIIIQLLKDNLSVSNLFKNQIHVSEFDIYKRWYFIIIVFTQA